MECIQFIQKANKIKSYSTGGMFQVLVMLCKSLFLLKPYTEVYVRVMLFDTLSKGKK